jgi:hypothetical protein
VRLSASAPSSHDLSLATFTINIAEPNFQHTHHITGISRRGTISGTATQRGL